jgi:tetratricopeptide (TPR) repeat protein
VVLVTSRERLPGIIARHGARALELGVLPGADAVALLRALIGDRVRSEPDAAMMLAAQCARLPLALRVAAERAAAHPGDPLWALSDELADERRGLERPDAGGDARTKVRSVFSWSYRNLGADAARCFRLLGLHPGPDLDIDAAVALTGSSPQPARAALGALTAAHLVQRTGGGRYVMHDLLRAYAVSVPADGEETRSAINRLLDYYLAAERPVLVAVTGYAAQRGWPQHATRLAATLSRYLVTGGYNTEAIAIYVHALDAARRCGDRGAQATALVNLAEVRWRLGRAEPDAECDRVLAAFREVGDRVGEARAHGNLALLAWRQGRYAQACGHYEQALALFRQIGERAGQARALDNLGAIRRRQGHYAEARSRHEEALTIFLEIGDRGGQARALANLGRVHLGQQAAQKAAHCLEDSLRLSRQTGDRACQAEALTELGALHLSLGRLEQAGDLYRQAIALFREIGHQGDEAEALNGGGEVLLATGRPEQARARHALALDLALQIADVDQQARAHRGLAHAYAAEGDYRTARHHAQHALDLYRRLAVPEAHEVAASLDAYSTALGAATP